MNPSGIRSSTRPGAVMVIALLGMTLLAAMVFYIYNVGSHVQKRIETQNAADAAVISGAGWVARQMNLVAMHNVEITRTLAWVQLFDALPEATAYTLDDTETALRACESQLVRGGLPRWVREGLVNAENDLRNQLEDLQEMHFLFTEGGVDVRTYTHYHVPEDAPYPGTPDRRGRLWQAMEAMDALSVVGMEMLGDIAPFNAQRAAEVNQRSEKKGLAFMPAYPSIPWERTTFEDFHRPLTQGLLPKRLDNPEVRRGPYDTLFGWRDPIHAEQLPTHPPKGFPGAGTLPGERWKSPWSQVIDAEPAPPLGPVVAYRVYGPYEAMLRGFREKLERTLPHSSYFDHARRLSDHKLHRLFPGAAPDHNVIQPDWVRDYEQALERLETSGPPVASQYLVLDFIQEQKLSASGLPLGVPPTPRFQRWSIHRPQRSALNPPRLRRIADYVWEDEQTDDDLAARRRTILTRYFVFAGANFGREVAVRNPNNFTEGPALYHTAPLPAPVQLDTARLPHDDPQAKLDHLTFGVVAYQDARAPLMGDGFEGPKDDSARPHTNVTAIAQAEVFNNHSWDLWTQMWHAQLVPVDLEWMGGASVRSPDAFDPQPEINMAHKLR